jgi:hydroxymethylglutaryl-CoA lyase
MTPPRIAIVEVGPRDGLQNEAAAIPVAAKVAFVEALAATGVAEVEVTAFVSPKAIPQLADAEPVLRAVRRRAGVRYSALVPNLQGLERAQAVGVDRVAVFTAASESFNRRNINASIAESIERFRPVCAAATVPVRGYVSTAFWCPFEGRIAPAAVVDVTRRLADLGVAEVSIGDTIGKASPADVRALLDVLLPAPVPLALHFHDTYGMAVANALTAWREYGIAIFDSSAGGLGGCPYAPGASGNVATEDLCFALAASGADPGVDVDAVIAAARALEPHVGRPIASHLAKARAIGEPRNAPGRPGL